MGTERSTKTRGPRRRARATRLLLWVWLCAPTLACEPASFEDADQSTYRMDPLNNLDDAYRLLDALAAEKAAALQMAAEMPDLAIDTACKSSHLKGVAVDLAGDKAVYQAQAAACEAAEQRWSAYIKAKWFGGAATCVGVLGAFFSFQQEASGAEYVWIPPSAPELAARIADLFELAQRLDDVIRDKECECSSLTDPEDIDDCQQELQQLRQDQNEALDELEDLRFQLDLIVDSPPDAGESAAAINAACADPQCNTDGVTCPYVLPPEEEPPEPPEAGFCCPVCQERDPGPCGECAAKYPEMYFGARCITPSGDVWDLGMHEIERSDEEPSLLPYHVLGLDSEGTRELTFPGPYSRAQWTRVTPQAVGAHGLEFVSCEFGASEYGLKRWSFLGDSVAWMLHNPLVLGAGEPGSINRSMSWDEASGCDVALVFADQAIPSWDASSCSGVVSNHDELTGYTVIASFQGKSEDPPVGEVCESGDYNGDYRVDQADLDYVLLEWGKTTSQADLDAVLVNWGSVYG